MGTIELTDAVKTYDAEQAVDQLTLSVRDGEFMTLVGPSGCGKSTTLELIAGLTNIDAGSVQIAGRDVTGTPPKDRGISMVFQNIALFPHMDAADNIGYGLRLRNRPSEDIAARVESVAETLQISELLNRMPSELSGGQRQRVAIGRAIVRDPEVFLMDEPLANLDAKLRVHMRTELQRLHKELDTTIVYVTHDQAEAMTMSDRIAVISDGCVQQVAPPLTCYNEPANEFVAGFIGSPSMNLLDVTADTDALDTTYFRIPLAETEPASDSEAATLGVRPEDIYLEKNATEATRPSDPISMMVDVLEPMGDEMVVYLRGAEETTAFGTNETQLRLSVPPEAKLAENDAASIVLDYAKIHLFDEDGNAFAHGLNIHH